MAEQSTSVPTSSGTDWDPSLPPRYPYYGLTLPPVNGESLKVPAIMKLTKALGLIDDATEKQALYQVAADLKTLDDVAHESTASLATMVVLNALRDLSRQHTDEPGQPFWKSEAIEDQAQSLIFRGAVQTLSTMNPAFGRWMQTCWIKRRQYMETIGRDYCAYVHDILLPETALIASLLEDEIPQGPGSRGMAAATKSITTGATSCTAPYLLRFKRRMQATESLQKLKSRVDALDPEETDAAFVELRKIFTKVHEYENKVASYCTQDPLNPSGQDAYMTAMYGPCLVDSWKSVSSASAGGEPFVKTSAREGLEKEHTIVRVIRTDCKDPDIEFSADLKGMLEYTRSEQFKPYLAEMWEDRLEELSRTSGAEGMTGQTAT
ncbi:uncharacterized protein MKK02DRAFT_30791 [Dioszegia hungarica]|uniref:Uncharacterized protein n=1 Tax=Dioszegia hungarica TaxID=4972 RepID=A0AA38LST5_9TREE|nr:uncharacterized protein MKK02DRAFT_30791 [Dioszegia hungarica]KAI9631786.1 hypothetical protein MKK02DRAFT_30791 [Dioszegia hungarica]